MTRRLRRWFGKLESHRIGDLKVGVFSEQSTETEIYTLRPGEPIRRISEGSLRALFITKTSQQ